MLVAPGSTEPGNHDRVGDDLPCRSCDYNLRTLPWNGVCPECGADVRAARLPQGFRFASWRELRRTRGAAHCIIAAILFNTLTELCRWTAEVLNFWISAELLGALLLFSNAAMYVCVLALTRAVILATWPTRRTSWMPFALSLLPAAAVIAYSIHRGMLLVYVYTGRLAFALEDTLSYAVTAVANGAMLYALFRAVRMVLRTRERRIWNLGAALAGTTAFYMLLGAIPALWAYLAAQNLVSWYGDRAYACFEFMGRRIDPLLHLIMVLCAWRIGRHLRRVEEAARSPEPRESAGLEITAPTPAGSAAAPASGRARSAPSASFLRRRRLD